MKKGSTSEVELYGLTISTDECYAEVMAGGGRMAELFKVARPYVYQEPRGICQVFLFGDVRARKTWYRKARELGFKTVAFMTQKVYVESKYLRQDEREANYGQ